MHLLVVIVCIPFELKIKLKFYKWLNEEKQRILCCLSSENVEAIFSVVFGFMSSSV